MKKATALCAMLTAISIAACSGQNEVVRTRVVGPNGSQASGVNTSRKVQSPTLYVQNSPGSGDASLSVYSAGTKFVRSIDFDLIWSSTTDSSGHAFVAYPANPNNRAGESLLNIYANQGKKLVGTLHQSAPFLLLTIDHQGNLFTNCRNRVYEYPADSRKVVKQRVVRKIQLSKFHVEAEELAVDGSGDLAVDDPYEILVFAPGQTKPYWTIPQINTSIAFDSAGNLYAADATSIFEYAPGQQSPSRTLSYSAVGGPPQQMAFDGAGNLYALSVCLERCDSSSIAVYLSGSSAPDYVITKGLISPGSLFMAVQADGTLDVANAPGTSGGNVVQYGPGGTSPNETISMHINSPWAVSVTP